ncbi:hypothetical protein JW992_09150, partial [candidate division KSB1 bacterium]|nr:hypothetical protein [candidate division KSB1 bacterium]
IANLICCEEKSLLFLHQLGCVVSPFGTPVDYNKIIAGCPVVRPAVMFKHIKNWQKSKSIFQARGCPQKFLQTGFL